MMEAEAVTDTVQMEDAVLLQAEDHLHIVLVEGHQMEDCLHAVLMEDHQVEEAVLQEQEATDHLHQAMAEVVMEDLKILHQKEEVDHQAADVDVRKVVHPTDKFHQVMLIEK